MNSRLSHSSTYLRDDPQIPWPDPTPEHRDDPRFNAIWNLIKSWDIAVPEAYFGYTGATGNHVRAILDALDITPIGNV